MGMRCLFFKSEEEERYDELVEDEAKRMANELVSVHKFISKQKKLQYKKYWNNKDEEDEEDISAFSVAEMDEYLAFMAKTFYIDEKMGDFDTKISATKTNFDLLCKKVKKDMKRADKLEKMMELFGHSKVNKEMFLLREYRKEQLDRFERVVYRIQTRNERSVSKIPLSKKLVGYFLLLFLWLVSTMRTIYFATYSEKEYIQAFCFVYLIIILVEVFIQSFFRILVIHVIFPSIISEAVQQKSWADNISHQEFALRKLLPSSPSIRVSLRYPDLMASKMILGDYASYFKHIREERMKVRGEMQEEKSQDSFFNDVKHLLQHI